MLQNLARDPDPLVRKFEIRVGIRTIYYSIPFHIYRLNNIYVRLSYIKTKMTWVVFQNGNPQVNKFVSGRDTVCIFYRIHIRYYMCISVISGVLIRKCLIRKCSWWSNI
jgi:hypothetical protein